MRPVLIIKVPRGKYGEVVAVLSDDADSVTAEERGSQIYRIAFDSGETADFPVA